MPDPTHTSGLHIRPFLQQCGSKLTVKKQRQDTNSLLQQETMESYNETLPLSQLGNDKNVTMATSEQQQLMMAAHIELLNKSAGRGEAIGGELVNYQGPHAGCIIL